MDGLDNGTIVAIAAIIAIAVAVLAAVPVRVRSRRLSLIDDAPPALAIGGIGIALWIAFVGPYWMQPLTLPVLVVGLAAVVWWFVTLRGHSRSRDRYGDQIPGRAGRV